MQALDRAVPCCATLASLDYRPIEREGSQRIELRADSPLFAFPTGHSLHAAFRLPDWPRPLEVRVTSRPTPPLLLAGIDPNRPIFNPALLLLDAQFVKRRVAQVPEAFAVKACGPASGGPQIRVEGEILVADGPQQAACLVVLTTDALRAQSVSSSGLPRDGYSPLGLVELEVRSAPFVQPPVLHRSPASLPAPERAATLPGLTGAAGVLFVDAGGIRYADLQDGRYRERLSLDYERIVQARVRPGWFEAPVAIAAGSTAPIVEFRDPPSVPTGIVSRILDARAEGRPAHQLGLRRLRCRPLFAGSAAALCRPAHAARGSLAAPAYPLQALAAADGRLLADALQCACDGLAGALMRAAAPG